MARMAQEGENREERARERDPAPPGRELGRRSAPQPGHGPSLEQGPDEVHQVLAGPEDAGERLDRVLAASLAARVPGLSRSRLQALIGSGAVTRGGTAVRDVGLR